MLTLALRFDRALGLFHLLLPGFFRRHARRFALQSLLFARLGFLLFAQAGFMLGTLLALTPRLALCLLPLAGLHFQRLSLLARKRFSFPLH